ncbi:MAG TPA: hypothetical protein VFV38_48285 [Ktedonobacteraceae bacterium]|nr:hypothetical protein [Ktedonobacteraceae bacterium]
MPREKKSLVNLNEQIAVGYYTAQEAQKRLGMTRDMFNNHVKQGTIKKTTFVGSHGYYKKTEIDALAEKIETLLLTAHDQNLEYRTATLDDLDAEIDLAALNFGRKRAEATREARTRYLQANPEVTHYLFSQGRLVAAINLVPLTHDAILEFRAGKRGWLFETNQIKQFEPGRRLECIIIDMMATTRVPLDQRHHYAADLLNNFSRTTLVEWARRGVDIATIDACAGTDDGERILKRAGFTYAGKHEDREMYHLNMDEAHLKILQPYKNTLARWKAR